MRSPKEGRKWADADCDEKACAHLRSQNNGPPNSIANNTLAVMPVLPLRMTIPPSLVLRRRGEEEGTRDLDDEEGQQLFGVKHDA